MTSRTIDIDRLFTRDIFFKDASNRPISANKVLLTRGDGGIYFSNLPDGGNSSTPTAFNNFRAGDNLQFTASNASNTLWFESGAGIQFYSTIDVTQPKFWIAATAPEQIRVTGNGSGVVNFSTLTDELVGGRTLYFAGTGDTTVNVSDTTVLFGSAYNSSYSSLVQLQSTTLELYIFGSTLVSSVNQTLSTVNFFLLSTSISSIYSTLLYVQEQTDYVSSFVWSTFTNDANNNRNILTINQISSSHVQASTLQAGANILADKTGVPFTDPDCMPYAQDGYAKYTYSTTTNLMTIQDNTTAVKFAIEKDAQYGTSTFFNSTFEKVVLQSQVGMQTRLSTGSTFVPILQQLEIRESENTSGILSSIIDYRVVNIANLDEICAPNGLAIHAPVVSISTLNVSSITGIAGIGGATSTFSVMYVGEIRPSTVGGTTFIDNATLSSIVGNVANITDLRVSSINGVVPFPSTFSTAFFSTSQTNNATISTLNVSTINGIQPFFNPQLSSFSTIYISTMYDNQGFINDLRVSSINGFAPFISTFSTLQTSSITANVVSTTQLYADVIQARLINVNVTSTTVISTSIVQATTLSSVFTNTGILTATNGAVTALNVSSINGREPFISSYQVLFASTFNNMIANISDLRVSSINGIVPFPSTFSTAFFSTSQTNNATISTLNVSTINGIQPFFNPQLSSFSTIFISTMYDNQGFINDLRVSSINGFAPFLSSFSSLTTSSIAANVMSTGQLIADTIQARLINVTITSTTLISTSIVQATTLSSVFTNTGILTATNGSVTNLNVSSINGREPFISSYEILFASTFNNMIANISDLRVSSINGIVPFPSTFSTAFFSTSQTNNATISTLNVSTINGIQPFFNPQLSSFSTIFISTMYDNQGFINDLRVSTINGFAPFISSFSSLTTSSITANVMSTGQLIADTIQARLINVTITSTTLISTSIVQATTLSSIFTNTGILTATQGYVTDLNVSSINGREPFISSYEILFASTFNNMIANISDLHVSSINGIVPFPSTFSTAYVSSLTADSISTGIVYADSIFAQYIDVQFISTTILSSFEITADLVSTSLLYANTAGITDLYISTINGLPYLTSSFSTLIASTAQAQQASISDLTVSSINGINPFFQETVSTFSTLYWSTAQGLDASISSLRLSTVMGNELPIFTFDMEQRRVGVNLGPTQQPRCTLDINGIAYASNFVTMSDRRHKKNVSTLDVDVNMLPRGYRFQWRKDDAWDIGCMADEVELFAPEAVYMTHDGSKTVSYHKLVPACLNMIRKLSERMEMLERKLNVYEDL